MQKQAVQLTICTRVPHLFNLDPSLCATAVAATYQEPFLRSNRTLSSQIAKKRLMGSCPSQLYVQLELQ